MGGAGVTVKWSVLRRVRWPIAVPQSRRSEFLFPFFAGNVSPTKRNYIQAGFLGVLLIRKESVLVECFSFIMIITVD